MTAFRLALLHLSRHRASTIVAIVCVASATLSAGFLVSIVTAIAGPLERLDTPYDAIVGSKSSGLSVLLGALGAGEPSEEVIPYALARFLERKEIARHIVPIHACGRFQTFPVFATDDRYLNRPPDLDPPHIAEGTWFENPDQAVIGSTVFEENGLDLGDLLLVEGLQTSATGEETRWRRELVVAGLLEKTESPLDGVVFVSLETGNEAYLWAKQRGLVRETKDDEAITYLWVSVEPGDLELLKHWMHAASVSQYVDTREELAFLRSLVGGAKAAGWALGAFVLLMAGISIAVLALSRYESLRSELGVLRALGYARSQVAGWMLWEAFLISATGLLLAILGEGFGLGVFDLPYRLEWSDTPTPWPTRWNGAVWGAVLLTSILAASLAVLRLYRSDVQKTMQGF